MAKHVRKILNAQRDVLAPEAIQNVQRSVDGLCAVVRGKIDHGAVDAKMTELETTANKWLKQYPNPGLRENIEVLLVAIAVAMAIRTFLSSRSRFPPAPCSRPSLASRRKFANHPEVNFPNAFSSFFIFWFKGISYTHKVAKSDGSFRSLMKNQKSSSSSTCASASWW